MVNIKIYRISKCIEFLLNWRKLEDLMIIFYYIP